MVARTELRASLVAQVVKNLPAIQETQVQCLGWEDPLEKEMATYSSILAWRIPWDCRVRHDRVTNIHTSTHTPTWQAPS